MPENTTVDGWLDVVNSVTLDNAHLVFRELKKVRKQEEKEQFMVACYAMIRELHNEQKCQFCGLRFQCYTEQHLNL